MSGKITCDRCSRQILILSGLLFGPPDENGMVKKQTLCVDCYKALDDFVTSKEFSEEEIQHAITFLRKSLGLFEDIVAPESKPPCPYCDNSDPGKETYPDGTHIRCAQNRVLSTVAGGPSRKFRSDGTSTQYLTMEEIRNLPTNSLILVTWSDGNGPHIYRVRRVAGVSYAVPRDGFSGAFDMYKPITPNTRVQRY